MDLRRNIKLLFPKVYFWKCTRAIRKNEKLPEGKRQNKLSKLYKKHLGRDLDWNNLNRYTEKMQWKKLYSNTSLEKLASDKLSVRQYVSDKIGAQYLIPLLGAWEKFDDIDFNSLPPKFVLKTSHGSSNIVIVKDKELFDRKYSRLLFNMWMSIDYAFASFEMHYENIPRKIIAEKYMEDQFGELRDYKFMCFDGKPYCCWVDKGRFSNHTRDIFDMNWNLLPFTDVFPNSGEDTEKPQNFELMVEIASTLSKDFSHVRVDLYNVDGTIYFGELTFCESSGFGRITPDEYDYKLGEMWHLPISD